MFKLCPRYAIMNYMLFVGRNRPSERGICLEGVINVCCFNPDKIRRCSLHLVSDLHARRSRNLFHDPHSFRAASPSEGLFQVYV